MVLRAVSLEDKYTETKGPIFLNGTQALAKLPLLQRAFDERQGLKTAGFISGYRGSPLGGFDLTLWRAKHHLKNANIVFSPGINEDLGATAVWGSQQLHLFPKPEVQGVFAMWYGKGPGVDRSGDVFKHANAAGTSLYGGVLALAGDDHSCKSSTLPHQSEYAFMDASIPVMFPSDIQDVLDLGLYGWALSRYSGCWVAFKILADTVDTSATVNIDLDRYAIVIPEDFQMPLGGLNLRWPDIPVEQEKRLQLYKLEAVKAFVRTNKLDRVIVHPKGAKLGVVTAGKSYHDVLQAFQILEIKPEEVGVGIYKVAVNWPVEPQGILAFCSQFDEILVVEEKRPVLEGQIKDILYPLPASKRPSVVGKRDDEGNVLLTPLKDLDAPKIALALAKRLLKLGIQKERIQHQIHTIEAFQQEAAERHAALQRIPYYCSGCPHNTSTTQLPEGSRAVAGIGCHYMATWIAPNTSTFTHMGGEGATWIGQAPFTREEHIFSNLGDGTYFHSGILAIRAAIAAGVNITYKILYNDAVAMTGGQHVDGTLTVPQITQQMYAEGVGRIVVVSDNPNHYDIGAFAHGVTLHHRDDLQQIQEDLTQWTGVSVLIYDQTCAAEKRRRRKRGLMEDPPQRVFINESVCEDCGDCSKKSNCLSVVPVDTAFGRKRAIDQSSCNKDYSCLNGFCPSFVSVEGGKMRKKKASFEERLLALPDPEKPLLHGRSYAIYLTGIGGTGVVTIGALLGMAAHLEGKAASIVDMAGLAQKGGAVVAHIRLAGKPEDIKATRISLGEADLVLGADVVVTASSDSLATINRQKTTVIINHDQTITGQFTQDSTYDFHQQALHQAIESVSGKDKVHWVQATSLATRLLGDSIATNLFLLGYAYQRGTIPLSFEAIERTIELNDVSVESNKLAFRWGRMAAFDKEYVLSLIEEEKKAVPITLEDIIQHRRDHLTAYQHDAYADRYEKLVRTVEAVDKELGKTALSLAVAKNYAKLLAYKDEYEVARLYTDGTFLNTLKEQFEGDLSLTFHLAPPLFAPKDPRTGHLKKVAFGSWVWRVFRLLAKFKGLRGTRWDIFSYTHERIEERQLILDYEAMIGIILADLTTDRYESALALVSLPDKIRGFGHVKEASIKAMRAEQASLWTQWTASNHPA